MSDADRRDDRDPQAAPRQPGSVHALALQITTRSVGALAEPGRARQAIHDNVRRVAASVEASVAFIAEEQGARVRLVVLPEYSLTGAPTGGRFVDWRARAAIEMDGWEYAELGRLAAALDLFLAGNAYEADPYFPDLYFQTSFIIAPAGSVVLRYRRLVSLYSPSPYDVLERYLDIYGAEALFPVLDSEIGRLAAVASEEILYPEISRCLALRGAEILVHSTSEMGSPIPTAKEVARRARAVENLVYVVSANAAGVEGTFLPSNSTTGMAKIVDYEGRILAAASSGGDSLGANAAIDFRELRERRHRTGLTNTLVRQPLQAYAKNYRNEVFHAAGQLRSGTRDAGGDRLRRTQLDTIDKLDRLGLI